MLIQHKIYQNDVPNELAIKANQIYHSFYCIKDYFYYYRKIEKLNAFIIYKNNEIVQVIYYIIIKNDLIVLNEFFEICQFYMNYFVTKIFEQFINVNNIHFKNIHNEIKNLSYPCKCWSVSHDIVIEFPDNVEEFNKRLGKKTRKTLRYYTNKLEKNFEDFSFHALARDEIDPEIISTISKFNRIRMKKLKITTAIDREFEQNTILFCKQYGIVGFIKANQKIAAGAVCYEVGEHSYGEILAYDESFSDYRVALICAYSIMTKLIERGSRIFHMSFGESEYKFRLGGIREPVYTLSVFRNNYYQAIAHLKYFHKYHYIKKLNGFIKYKLIDKLKHSIFKN